MKYRIYDDEGLIADAKTFEEAYAIFEDITEKRNDYKEFESHGDIVLCEQLFISK